MDILLRLNEVSKSFEQGRQKIEVLDRLDFIVVILGIVAKSPT